MKSKILPLFVVSLCHLAQAADVTWDISPGTVGAGDSAITGGTGSWDNVTGNWTTDAGANNVVWDNALNAADTAVFSGAAAGTVTTANVITAGGLKFTKAGYTLAGTSAVDFAGTLGAITASSLSSATSSSDVSTITAPLSGTAGLTIAANGNITATGGSSGSRVTISGTNTALTGGIAITAGLVDFSTTAAAGSAATTAGSGNLLTLSNNAGLISPNGVTLGNNIALGASIFRVYGSKTLTLNGLLSGTGFNKTDSGTLALGNGASTFTGAVAVQSGLLQLGTTSGTFTFNYPGNALSLASGTTLRMGGSSSGTATHTYNFSNLTAPIAVTGATIDFSSTNTTTKQFNSALAFSGTSTVSVSSGSFTNTINLNRPITGSGTLNFTWPGGGTGRSMVIVAGQTHNFTGSIVLGNASVGTATPATHANFNLNSPLGLADWTLNDVDWNLNLPTGTQTFKSLSGTAGNIFGVGVATVLDIGSGNTDTTYAGTIGQTTGNTLALTKSGTGKLTLSSANTYTGQTLVTGGILSLGVASLADAADVKLTNGAVLDLTHPDTDTIDELYIDGVQQASGTWGSLTSTATHKTARITGTGILQVTTGSTGGYSTWATANAGGGLPDGDFDNDGVKNGVEYFFGATGSSGTPNPAVINGTITWPKDATAAATPVVETSADLVNWTPVTFTDNGSSIQYTLPAGDPKRFVRLRVTVP